jgi:small basic protein
MKDYTRIARKITLVLFLSQGLSSAGFIAAFTVNALVAVLLTFVGDRLGLDLYLVALIAFGLRIFQNVALIRRHFL